MRHGHQFAILSHITPVFGSPDFKAYTQEYSFQLPAIEVHVIQTQTALAAHIRLRGAVCIQNTWQMVTCKPGYTLRARLFYMAGCKKDQYNSCCVKD